MIDTVLLIALAAWIIAALAVALVIGRVIRRADRERRARMTRADAKTSGSPTLSEIS